MASHYIEVIVPLALRGVFTYAVPDALLEEVIVGKRVVVPFGAKRLYSAIVYQTDVLPRKGTKPKEVAYVLDNEAIVTDAQLRFWQWISEYYMCGLGGVMLAALPGAMRLSSQTMVMVNESTEYDDSLEETDRMLLANLNGRNAVAVDVLEKLSSKASIQRSLDKLLKLGLIDLREEVDDHVKPKTQTFIHIAEEFENQEKLSKFLDDLTRAPKQLELMMSYIQLSDFFSGEPQGVLKGKLLNTGGASALKSLIDKGALKSIDRLVDASNEVLSMKDQTLNDDQLRAVAEIQESWKSKEVALLHGVTGSGKTLVYASLVKQVMQETAQVLYLVPEIALTTQLVGRLKALLGENIMVYHSRFSNRERLTMWHQMLGPNKPKVIVGARSSVFLPFSNLKLIVIDEEHEASYKQHETAPYYNARDAGIWLAASFKAKVLLGSATPSVESSFHAEKGKFGLSRLDKRFGDIKLPEIKVVDLRKEQANKTLKADFASSTVDVINQTLRAKKQVIIFQNRRGYAPFQLCESCGWSAECDNCDVNLTYHKYFEKLLCHYCGFSLKQPKNCPNCGSAKLKIKGYGTEKIEDDLEILFPEARIARMDLDTTRKKNALQNIITSFEEGSVELLVGTQMVTKGLDFENVGLVVVMNADTLWNRPDFRAFERAFQLLTQVAGRAGRKRDRGQVLVQTYRPDHPVLDYVIRNDYQAMFELQLLERRQFGYPPFSRMLRIQLAHQDAKLVKEAAKYMAGELKVHFGERLLGPEEPPIARIRNRYLRQMFVKLETSLSLQKSKQVIWQCIDLIEGHQEYRKVRLSVDVDPL